MNYSLNQSTRFPAPVKPHIVCSRVKFNGTAVYSDASLASDDDKFEGITGTALQQYLNGSQSFTETRKNSIYRLAGGTTAGTYSIPLARVTRLSRIGVVGIIQTTCTSANGTMTLSVGTLNDKTNALGNQPLSALATPTGGTNSIWHPTGAQGSASTCAEAVTYTFSATEFNAYLGSLIVAPSTVISLHINNSNAITAGDITFYIYADPLDPGIIFDPLELITKDQVNRGQSFQCVIPAY